MFQYVAMVLLQEHAAPDEDEGPISAPVELGEVDEVDPKEEGEVEEVEADGGAGGGVEPAAPDTVK